MVCANRVFVEIPTPRRFSVDSYMPVLYPTSAGTCLSGWATGPLGAGLGAAGPGAAGVVGGGEEGREGGVGGRPGRGAGGPAVVRAEIGTDQHVAAYLAVLLVHADIARAVAQEPAQAEPLVPGHSRQGKFERAAEAECF